MAALISGKTREAFTDAAMSACLENQKNHPDNKPFQFSRETIAGYCSCYVDSLANLTTFGDLNNYQGDGKVAPELQKKVDKVSPPCWESTQRKLMGAGEK